MNLGSFEEKENQANCVKSVRIRIYSGPHFLAFGMNMERYRISPYSVRMQENADQNNSEYRHFLRSESHYNEVLKFFVKDFRPVILKFTKKRDCGYSKHLKILA